MSGDLSLEDLCIHFGLDYKESMGSKGAQLNLRECPHCGNEKWKVYANEETSLGNCFSCSTNFNLFKFAGFILAKQTGAAPDNRQIGGFLNDVRKAMGYRPTRPVVTKPAVKLRQDFELPFNQPLPYSDGWVHPYLLKRGIDGRYAKMFDLRYSTFGSWVYKDDQGKEHRQSFAERILIPVYDLDGKLVTFQGRDATGTSDLRYKFAGGLPGTARFLYNGYTAKATKAKHVIMAEGAFDVIGIQKAIDADPKLSGTVPIGSWGKHLSVAADGPDQIGAFSELKRCGCETVTILYDPEPAAYVEAIEAALHLIKIGLRPRIATLPKGVDPGEADVAQNLSAIHGAQEYNRITGLRLRMNNPYLT